MSRNSKNARRKAQAKVITKLHQDGGKGPAKTTPKHGKRWTYRSNPVLMKSMDEFLKGQTPRGGRAKTSGAEILEKAGAASAED